MKKLRIVVLSLALLILQAAMSAEELDTIEVRASAFHNRSPDDLAQSVTIITDEELEEKRKSSIGETLSRELGVSSTYFAPGASYPIIRGLGTNRVRILENGIDSLDVSSTSEDHAVSIEPYTANQIEVIRGPSTLRFGSGAIGGVVNIVNDRLLEEVPAAPFEIDVNMEHASVSDGTTSNIELNGGTGNFAWHGDYTYRKTNDYDIDGFADEEDREDRGRLRNSDIDATKSWGAGGAFINDSFILGLSYSQFKTDYGLPGHEHDEHDEHEEHGDVRVDMDQDRYDLSAKLINPVSGIEQISLRTGYVDYEHNEFEPNGEAATTFENKAWENRLELLTGLLNWSTVFGFQYNDEEFFAAGEEAFVDPVNSELYGLFAVAQRELGDWNVEVGARVERVEYDPEAGSDEDFDMFSVSLGLIRSFANDAKLSFNLSRSERAPEKTALFAYGPHLATLTFERGDTDLDEEKSFNFEIGLGKKHEKFRWQVNTFYNRVNDYIFLQSVDANKDGTADREGELLLVDYVNEDVEFYGIEAEIVSRLINASSYTLDGRLFMDQVRGEKRGSEGGNLPRIPPRRIGLDLDFDRGYWHANMRLTYVDDQEHVAHLEMETDSYTMLNAGVSYTVPIADASVRLFLRGENLLDEDARRHSSFNAQRVPLPGAGVHFGISVKY